MVICLERDADLHKAQLMLLPLTVSCSSKTQIGFTFLVPAHPGSPGKRAVKWVCVCVFMRWHCLVAVTLVTYEKLRVSMLCPVSIHHEAEKRNQFSFVCISFNT